MRRKGICLLFACAGLLCGCSASELEDRCFPMLALVDYDAQKEETSFSYTFPTPRRSEDQGDSTEDVDTAFSYGSNYGEAWKNYEERLNKEADYNHLKVVVLGESFINDRVLYNQMLDFIQKQENFPRNAYVCVLPETKQLLEIEGRLSDDAGSYLEDFIQNHENGKSGELVTLGKLIDEKDNRRIECNLPYLTVDGSNIVWQGWYYVVEGVPQEYQGTRDSRETESVTESD